MVKAQDVFEGDEDECECIIVAVFPTGKLQLVVKAQCVFEGDDDDGDHN